MVLKKPTKKQYENLFGPIADQVKAVLALSFNDDGSPVFADEANVSYRKFCEVVESLKKIAEDDVAGGAFVTKGLAIVDIYVNEVNQLFAIKDPDERFAELQKISRGKLRLDGHSLSDEEFTSLPYSDQIVAVNKTIKDITGESENPLPKSAKE